MKIGSGKGKGNKVIFLSNTLFHKNRKVTEALGRQSQTKRD